MVRKLSSAAVLAIVYIAGMGQAHAIATPCSGFSPDVTGSVTGTSECQIDPAVDNDSPEGNFLAADWFDYDDWSQDAKDNDLDGVDEGANTLGFSVSGDRLSGEWMFSGNIAGLDVMLVFKDGQKSNPNGLVSYLVSATSGTYESMFFKDPENLDNPQQISHVSVWSRGESVQIPAPGVLGLLGLGLLGIMAVGRRRL